MDRPKSTHFTPLQNSAVPLLIFGALLQVSACSHLNPNSDPQLEMKQLQDSFSAFEGRRVILHACAYHDAHGVVVVDCNPAAPHKHSVLFMTVRREDANALQQYRSLFKVAGPAYAASLTGIPKLSSNGRDLLFEFESADGVSEVPGCSLWPSATACKQ